MFTFVKYRYWLCFGLDIFLFIRSILLKIRMCFNEKIIYRLSMGHFLDLFWRQKCVFHTVLTQHTHMSNLLVWFSSGLIFYQSESVRIIWINCIKYLFFNDFIQGGFGFRQVQTKGNTIDCEVNFENYVKKKKKKKKKKVLFTSNTLDASWG